MDYYAEQAKKEIIDRKERATTLAKAWRMIERYKTKEGADFKNLAQNFTKGAIHHNRYCPDEKEISVCEASDKGHYFDDWIKITKTVYSNSAEAKKYEAEGRLISRGAYLHPCIELTPDELEQEIKERAEYFDGVVADMDAVLKNFDEIAGKLVDMRKQAEAYLKEQPDEVYFILRKIIREEH